MAETAILAVIVVALLVERYLSNRAHAEEVARLTSAVIVKNAGELRMVDEVWGPAPPEPRVTVPLPEPLDGYEGQAGIS